MPELPEPTLRSVALAGDWHGDLDYMARAIPAARRALGGPDGAILHVGDFGLWPDRAGTMLLDSAEYWCQRSGIELVITPGNHEH